MALRLLQGDDSEPLGSTFITLEGIQDIHLEKHAVSGRTTLFADGASITNGKIDHSQQSPKEPRVSSLLTTSHCDAQSCTPGGCRDQRHTPSDESAYVVQLTNTNSNYIAYSLLPLQYLFFSFLGTTKFA